MKHLHILLWHTLFILPVAFFQTTYAQLSLGGNIGYNWDNPGGFSCLSLGVRTDLLIADKTRLAFDLTAYLPSTSAGEQSLRQTNMTVPTNDTVLATEMKLSGIQLGVAYKWYFTEDHASELAFYMPYGLAFNYFRLVETIDADYDKDFYHSPQHWEDGAYRESFFGISAHVGMGLDIPLKEKHLLYTELCLSYTLFSLGFGQNYVRLPSYLCLKAAYRFEFD